MMKKTSTLHNDTKYKNDRKLMKTKSEDNTINMRNRFVVLNRAFCVVANEINSFISYCLGKKKIIFIFCGKIFR